MQHTISKPFYFWIIKINYCRFMHFIIDWKRTSFEVPNIGEICSGQNYLVFLNSLSFSAWRLPWKSDQSHVLWENAINAHLCLLKRWAVLNSRSFVKDMDQRTGLCLDSRPNGSMIPTKAFVLTPCCKSLQSNFVRRLFWIIFQPIKVTICLNQSVITYITLFLTYCMYYLITGRSEIGNRACVNF